MTSIARQFSGSSNVARESSIYEEVDSANSGISFATFVADGVSEMPVERPDSSKDLLRSSPARVPGVNGKREEVNEKSSVIGLGRDFRRKVVGKRTMHTLQEWEGVVESVEDTKFDARLKDLTIDRMGTEFATIPISSVERDQRSRIKPGAIFRLIVGVAVTDKGNRINDAVVYFRNLRGANVGAEVANLIRSFPG